MKNIVFVTILVIVFFFVLFVTAHLTYQTHEGNIKIKQLKTQIDSLLTTTKEDLKLADTLIIIVKGINKRVIDYSTMPELVVDPNDDLVSITPLTVKLPYHIYPRKNIIKEK